MTQKLDHDFEELERLLSNAATFQSLHLDKTSELLTLATGTLGEALTAREGVDMSESLQEALEALAGAIGNFRWVATGIRDLANYYNDRESVAARAEGQVQS